MEPRVSFSSRVLQISRLYGTHGQLRLQLQLTITFTSTRSQYATLISIAECKSVRADTKDRGNRVVS